MATATYIPAIEQEQTKIRQQSNHAQGLSNIALRFDLEKEKMKEKIPSNKQPKRRRIDDTPGEAPMDISPTLGSPSGKSPPRILKLFPELLSKIFVDYQEKIQFKYRDWIPYEKIEQVWLCANTNIAAIEILKEACRIRGPDYLDWKELCRNPNALPLIEQYPNFIEYEELAYNSKAHALLMNIHETAPENFHWGNFSANSKAGLLIPDKSLEEAEMDADEYFELHDFEKLDWAKVSGNRSSYILDFLIKIVPFRINMGSLSGNPNPMAIDILTQRIAAEKLLERDPVAFEALPYNQKIDWFLLSANYSAVPLLMANRDKIRWDTIGANESARILIEQRIKIEEKYEAEEKEEDRKEHEREKEIIEIMKQIKSLREGLSKEKAKAKSQVDQTKKDFLLKEKAKSQVDQTKKSELEKSIRELKQKAKLLQEIKKKDKKEPYNRLNWCLICANRKLLNLVKLEYEKNNNKIESRLAYLAANPSIFILNKGGPYDPPENPTRFKTSSDNILR